MVEGYLYIHIKSGKIYELLHKDVVDEETLEVKVVYRCTNTGKLWIRDQELFEQRFKLFSTAPSKVFNIKPGDKLAY